MSAVATCACGAHYDEQQWQALPTRGYQFIPASRGDPDEFFELRTCECGSTISGPDTTPQVSP